MLQIKLPDTSGHIPPPPKPRKEKFVQEQLRIEEYPFEEPKEEKLEKKDNRGVVIIDLF